MNVHERIGRELACIPRGDLAQNELRAIYQMSRENDLGKRPEHPGTTAVETAERSAAQVRKYHPDFEPDVDWQGLGAAAA